MIIYGTSLAIPPMSKPVINTLGTMGMMRMMEIPRLELFLQSRIPGFPARSDEPYHMWRTQPDPRIFDPLMKTIATGVLRMPQLERFLFLIGMGYTDDDGIIFECLTSGEHPEWFQNPHKMVELDTTRCYVTLMPEAKWEIPRDIATLWKKFVGDKDSFRLRP